MTTVPFIVTTQDDLELRVINADKPNDFQSWPLKRRYALYLARELIRAVMETEARSAGE